MYRIRVLCTEIYSRMSMITQQIYSFELRRPSEFERKTKVIFIRLKNTTR